MRRLGLCMGLFWSIVLLLFHVVWLPTSLALSQNYHSDWNTLWSPGNFRRRRGLSQRNRRNSVQRETRDRVLEQSDSGFLFDEDDVPQENSVNWNVNEFSHSKGIYHVAQPQNRIYRLPRNHQIINYPPMNERFHRKREANDLTHPRHNIRELQGSQYEHYQDSKATQRQETVTRNPFFKDFYASLNRPPTNFESVAEPPIAPIYNPPPPQVQDQNQMYDQSQYQPSAQYMSHLDQHSMNNPEKQIPSNANVPNIDLNRRPVLGHNYSQNQQNPYPPLNSKVEPQSHPHYGHFAYQPPKPLHHPHIEPGSFHQNNQEMAIKYPDDSGKSGSNVPSLYHNHNQGQEKVEKYPNDGSFHPHHPQIEPGIFNQNNQEIRDPGIKYPDDPGNINVPSPYHNQGQGKAGKYPNDGSFYPENKHGMGMKHEGENDRRGVNDPDMGWKSPPQKLMNEGAYQVPGISDSEGMPLQNHPRSQHLHDERGMREDPKSVSASSLHSFFINWLLFLISLSLSTLNL